MLSVFGPFFDSVMILNIALTSACKHLAKAVHRKKTAFFAVAE